MQKELTIREIEDKLSSMKGWSFIENKLRKSFLFDNYRDAMSFIVRLSYEADGQNHHPEVFNSYNRVEVFFNTHDAGGKVTKKDFDLALAIDGVS
jgi:4a-hydroxytetrahydrobiopterin dehydratase